MKALASRQAREPFKNHLPANKPENRSRKGFAMGSQPRLACLGHLGYLSVEPDPSRDPWP